MNKFLIRTLSGAVYVLIVVCAIYAGRLTGNATLGSLVYGTVFFIIGIIGVYEYLNNIAKKGVECNWTMAFVAATVTYLTIFGASLAALPDELPYLMPTTVVLTCLLPVTYLSSALVELWHSRPNPFTAIAHSLLPSFWIMMPLALTNSVHGWSAGIIMMIFILIWVNDSFAYMTGMLIGKHKMWERHSPNKTWEGTIGGVLFCIATAILAGPHFHSHISPIAWAIIGLICGVVGTLGDLVESMFKRSCGVKDSGNIMPGHGGVLDRFDSILFAVPFVLLFLTIITL